MKDTETIHSDIPLPRKKQGRTSPKWEKFKTMEVGQCVFVETRAEANALKNFLTRRGFNVATRALDGQIGLWRLPDE